MNRRALLAALAVAPIAEALQQQPHQAQQAEFYQLVDHFIVNWNRLLAAVIEGTRPFKLADATVAAFHELIAHPGWPGTVRK